jgi:hypothetical protein
MQRAADATMADQKLRLRSFIRPENNRQRYIFGCFWFFSLELSLYKCKNKNKGGEKIQNDIHWACCVCFRVAVQQQQPWRRE